jgi:carbonic anhydrase
MQERISRRAALGSIAACACCLSGLPGLAAEKGNGKAHHWGYKGADAPDKWGELSPDFKACKLGMEQTPIDLKGAIRARFEKPVSLAYKAVDGKIVNNGHTIQVNVEKGCSCTIEGVAYELLQFHFHHPSEHLLAGKPFAMELHLVHKAESGALAVLGAFVKEGAPNALLAPIFDTMPGKAMAEKPLAALDPSGLLPASRGYYRYMGSLTTPPCSEGLTWTVFKDPIEASPEQIRKFAALFPNNARPVQERHRRYLLESDAEAS